MLVIIFSLSQINHTACTTYKNLLATRVLLRPPRILLPQQLRADLQPALDCLRQFVDLLVALVVMFDGLRVHL